MSCTDRQRRRERYPERNSFKTEPPLGAAGDIKAFGTYELVDKLAVFAGKIGTEEVRFAVNYAFPDGKVEFNGFFPDSDKVLRYQRKWFQKVEKEWKPLEELNLTMPREIPGQTEWHVKVQGERIRWDKAGEKTTEKIEETWV